MLHCSGLPMPCMQVSGGCLSRLRGLQADAHRPQRWHSKLPARWRRRRRQWGPWAWSAAAAGGCVATSPTTAAAAPAAVNHGRAAPAGAGRGGRRPPLMIVRGPSVFDGNKEPRTCRWRGRVGEECFHACHRWQAGSGEGGAGGAGVYSLRAGTASRPQPPALSPMLPRKLAAAAATGAFRFAWGTATADARAAGGGSADAGGRRPRSYLRAIRAARGRRGGTHRRRDSRKCGGCCSLR
ncbi:hypothetical protein I4F81_001641 [Pyropia yezoensis]|uniref:Uncharacterized protein n=1 Tax=Pyropia yezoensis TaxID=2788 RepID=A0ACC3BMB1_PYRYE|nr:hypothetical protein I4F81_001641 [Neopyropia yezoensis]